MKKLNLVWIALLSTTFFMASCGNSEQKAQGNSNESEAETNDQEATVVNLQVDVANSAVNWTGEMLGVYSHNGTIGITEGSIEMTGDMLSGGNFVINMTDIVHLDSNYTEKEGKRKEDLNGHLGAVQFFDVANHPTATFVITSVDGNTAEGKLTLRGTEGEERIDNITIVKEDDSYTINGDITFDRKKYGVSFDMPVADMVLSDDIKLSIHLSVK